MKWRVRQWARTPFPLVPHGGGSVLAVKGSRFAASRRLRRNGGAVGRGLTYDFPVFCDDP